MGHVSESPLGCDRGHGFFQGGSDDVDRPGALLGPRRSPNLNAFIERFIRSIKKECLDRVIPLGEAHLRELICEYRAHYRAERPHQGLGGALIQPSNDHAADGPLVRRERLGGLLNYYYREAA